MTDRETAPAARPLLPCPFCGGQAKHDEGIMGLKAVSCDDCGCNSALTRDADYAADLWNRRAPAVSHDEVMREALAPCPFCGGEAKLVEGEESAFVQCLDMKMHRALWADGDNAIADEVRDQWNRRAALSHQPGERSASADDIWDDATNAVCQAMQDADACRCPGGKCIAASVSPSPKDRAAWERSASDIARTDAEPIGEEPVAWRWRMDAEWNYTRIKPDPYASGEVQPLYARPAQPSGDALREALTMMVEEKCDYMRINNLGDPEAQHTVKVARAALASPTLSRQEVARAERERIAELVDTFADEADHEAICAGNYLVGEHRSAERMANRIAAAIRSLPDADTEGRDITPEDVAAIQKRADTYRSGEPLAARSADHQEGGGS